MCVCVYVCVCVCIGSLIFFPLVHLKNVSNKIFVYKL